MAPFTASVQRDDGRSRYRRVIRGQIAEHESVCGPEPTKLNGPHRLQSWVDRTRLAAVIDRSL